MEISTNTALINTKDICQKEPENEYSTPIGAQA